MKPAGALTAWGCDHDAQGLEGGNNALAPLHRTGATQIDSRAGAVRGHTWTAATQPGDHTAWGPRSAGRGWHPALSLAQSRLCPIHFPPRLLCSKGGSSLMC